MGRKPTVLMDRLPYGTEIVAENAAPIYAIWRSRHEEPEPVPSHVDSRIELEENLEIQMFARRIREIIADMPERTQQVLHLRLDEDITREEIAVELRISNVRVRQIELHGIRAIKMALHALKLFEHIPDINPYAYSTAKHPGYAWNKPL